MATLGITWETVDAISKAEKAVVTGESAEESTEAAATESPLKWSDKPILAYVCDENADCDGVDKLEGIVFKDEKVALGMKAFRRIKIHPDDAAKDAVLAGHGKAVPRMLFVHPTTLKVSVLEKNNLKAGKIFKQMKKVSGKFWKQKLDKNVSAHLKLLGKQDQLANAADVLRKKIAKMKADGDKEAKIAKVEKEAKEIDEEWNENRKAQKEIWKLTPKRA